MPNPPSFSSPLKLTATTPAIASKTCGANGAVWTTGTNRLTWPKLDRSSLDYAAMYLQRSSVDNVIPYFPSYSQIVNAAGPKSDSLWTTIKSWSNAEIVNPNEPTTWDDVVPHSTFYYYRLIFQIRASGTSPPYVEVDSGVATIVQPFDLSICTVDACTIPQNCRTLLWDAPQLYVPFITGSHCLCTNTGCAQGPWYRITVNPSLVPNTVTYDVYKSTVGPDSLALVVTNAALNACNEWFDSDATHTIWYQFKANRDHNSVIPSNILQLSY